MKASTQFHGMALAAGLCCLAARAAAQESSPVLPTPRADAFTIVIDSAELRRGRGTSLATFLAGRVPGLRVTFASGAPMTEPRLVSRSTSGTYARPEPLLFVDGVLLRDDPQWSPLDTSAAPSLGWGLPVEEIEEIRVVLGAAAGGWLEFGAARGAIYVTTRRPVPGATIVRAGMSATAGSVVTDGRANEGTLGTLNAYGVPTNYCRLMDQASGQCTPSGRVSWRPLEELAPYRSSQGYRADASASGALPGLTYRASAVRSGMEGMLPASRVYRNDLALALARDLSERLAMSVNARYAEIAGKLADWDAAGLPRWSISMGPVASDAKRAMLLGVIDNAIRMAPTLSTARLTLGSEARWRLSAATQLRASASVDRSVRETDQAYVVPAGLGVTESANRSSRFEATGVRLGASAVGQWPLRATLRLEGTAAANWSRSTEDGLYTAFDTVTYFSSPGLSNFVSTRTESRRVDGRLEGLSALLGARLHVGERGTLGAAVRHERFVHLKSRPVLKSLYADWDLARGRLVELRVRAAYGESVDHRAPEASPFLRRDRALEHTIEREAGLDALWGRRVEAGVARAVASVADGTNYWVSPGINSFGWLADGFGWQVASTTLRAAVRTAHGALTQWRVELYATERRATFTRVPTGTLVSRIGVGPLVGVETGRPVFEMQTVPFTFADTNGDGVIIPAETARGGYALQALGTPEPRWEFALHTSAELPFGLGFGAVLESRRGQKSLDVNDKWRCGSGACRALHDPRTPLATQAAAVAREVYVIDIGFIRDGSFARLREIYFEYPLPWLRRGSGTSGAMLRLSGQHLLTWSRLRGVDPEAMHFSGGVGDGATGLLLPVQPTVTLRLDIAR